MNRIQSLNMILVLAIVAALLGGCPAGQQTDAGQDEALSTPEPATQIYRDDNGYISVTINAPSYLSLSGPEPLVVKLPQNDVLAWESNQAKLTTVSFPMIIPFKVPKTAPGGPFELTLGLRLTYCNKADDICVLKNDVVKVPLDVMPGIRQPGDKDSPIAPVVYEIKEPEKKPDQN
ncbi:MAG: hypothetical protein P9M14_14160 [Candidatus Alcyoniella australis]|nr:hypothetical protein [Candidatus Alcyoniella australis]